MRVRTSTVDGAPYYILTDHLGNVAAWMNASGTLVGGSLARYEPFGGYRTKPASTVNPDISDRGFTGHRHNNTGTNNLGLIYMNARYYMPEVGRFISPDTIVPEPSNPQSFNRYAYVLNSPMNYTDPTGHAESSGCEYEGCLSDPDTWGDNFVAYLENTTDFNDPTDNPQGQIFLSFYYQTLPLGLEDGASVNEIVSQTIADTVSFMGQARVGWYPTTSDADLLVKTLLLVSVAEAGTDSSINGEQGSIRPPTNRSGLRRHLGAPPSDIVNPQAHHNLPWKHKDYFAGPGRGLNVNDAAFGRWVQGTPPGLHQKWTPYYEDAWDTWIDVNPNASRQEVLDFLQSLLDSGRYP